jgi:uncharacterized protein (TIGR03435 family)
MSLRRVLLLAAVSLALTTPFTRAQTTAPQPPVAPATAPVAAPASKPLAFDVASIRSNPKEQYHGVMFTPDGARAVGISLRNLLYNAYNQQHDFLWSGIPSWADSEHYDLVAKFNPDDFKDLTDEQHRTMLQALLADRFKLVLHHETKILPHYALMVAKGGPKMQETAPENIKLEDNRLFCHAGLSVFKQCTMAEFAYIVSWFGTNASVEDHTGLTARYDFTLNWAPPSATTPNTTGSPDASPDIFDALPEQLGLKLEPIKGPVPVLVIDHIERPTEN